MSVIIQVTLHLMSITEWWSMEQAIDIPIGTGDITTQDL